MNTLPTIPEVLANPCTSYWLANALRSALNRDPVDAINDAETLVGLLTKSARINNAFHERSFMQQATGYRFPLGSEFH
jgi:hypothetical protein